MIEFTFNAVELKFSTVEIKLFAEQLLLLTKEDMPKFMEFRLGGAGSKIKIIAERRIWLDDEGIEFYTPDMVQAMTRDDMTITISEREERCDQAGVERDN